MKRLINNLLIATMLMLSSLAYAKTGLLFQIGESGAAVSVDIILCLNGKSPLSCQNYHVSSRSLAISTVANHRYPAAGIKVVTPGYQATGCEVYSNGYCLFAIDGNTPTTITLAGNVPSYKVGGIISGLIGSVSLQNNGGDTLVRNNNGSFSFATPIAQGASYNVTVSSQPATQTCTVTNGSGTISAANVANIKITCSTNTYSLGGTITGLTTGSSVTLRNNNSDILALNSNGNFTFAIPIAQGSPYTVIVSAQPTTQTCIVTNGSGTMGNSNVTNIEVACTTNTFTVGGVISGLTGTIKLRNNNADELTANSDGNFTFATRVDQGALYNVTVFAQPTAQTCIVTNGSGTMGNSDVTNVQVSCTTNTYTVRGIITGLVGTIVLQNNGTDNLTRNTNGNFIFATPVIEGNQYNVTVLNQPLNQTCTVGNGGPATPPAGTTTVNVTVTCVTNPYSVRVNVLGLTGGNQVTLVNNGESMAVGNGLSTFATRVPQGAAYNVTVQTQPQGQTCTVTGGGPTTPPIGTTSVTVPVFCSATTFDIGGTVNGLNGQLALQNGADQQLITQDGSYSFEVAENAGYNVVIVPPQPLGQNCTISGPNPGTATGNITNINVTCISDPATLTVTPRAVIPVGNSGGVALTVNNTSTTTTATNVSVVLPSGWTDVIQDASVCTSIPPQTSCVINFTSNSPYIAEGNLSVIGDNISGSPVTALAFSVNNYLVWSIDTNARTVDVVDNTDISQNIQWGGYGTEIPNAKDLYDGVANTQAIVTALGTGTDYAARRCYESTRGGYPMSTWFLPAICQMGDQSSPQLCVQNTPNIGSLTRYGFGPAFAVYWSSTESPTLFPTDFAFYQIFVTSSDAGSQLVDNKFLNFFARCARTLTY